MKVRVMAEVNIIIRISSMMMMFGGFSCSYILRSYWVYAIITIIIIGIGIISILFFVILPAPSE